ncbi:hypothetical protein ACWGJ2_25710 [Streptomyces sp. NPDC054796]
MSIRAVVLAALITGFALGAADTRPDAAPSVRAPGPGQTAVAGR